MLQAVEQINIKIMRYQEKQNLFRDAPAFEKNTIFSDDFTHHIFYKRYFLSTYFGILFYN